MRCGRWCFVCLEFIGLCLTRLLSCLSLGRVCLDNIETWSCGELCLIACYGVFGAKEMLEALKDVNTLC